MPSQLIARNCAIDTPAEFISFDCLTICSRSFALPTFTPFSQASWYSGSFSRRLTVRKSIGSPPSFSAWLEIIAAISACDAPASARIANS